MQAKTEQQRGAIEQAEIEKLLKNIQEGLKKFTLKEFNQSLSNILNKSNDKNDLIDYVFLLIKEQYGISEITLKKKSRSPKIVEARRMAYCLLHFNLGFPMRYISMSIFKNWSNSVQVAIKRMKAADINHKADYEYVTVYNSLQEKLNKFISDNKK